VAVAFAVPTLTEIAVIPSEFRHNKSGSLERNGEPYLRIAYKKASSLLVKLVKVVLTVAKSVLIAVMPHPDASG
jgi:hypothetical protein